VSKKHGELLAQCAVERSINSDNLRTSMSGKRPRRCSVARGLAATLATQF
jgi:hypothetical protein